MGEMTRAILVENTSREVFLGIRFHPGYVHPFVRAPLHEFTDKTIELDTIEKPLSDQLKERVQEETSIQSRHQLIEHTLFDFIADSFEPEPCIEYAIQAILRSKGQVSIQALCQKMGYSSRYLQKKFKEVVGIGPKMLCRVVRFRNAYRCLKSSDCKQYAKTALDFGYFDQAHFNHDFKEFVGIPPSVQF